MWEVPAPPERGSTFARPSGGRTADGFQKKTSRKPGHPCTNPRVARTRSRAAPSAHAPDLSPPTPLLLAAELLPSVIGPEGRALRQWVRGSWQA